MSLSGTNFSIRCSRSDPGGVHHHITHHDLGIRGLSPATDVIISPSRHGPPLYNDAIGSPKSKPIENFPRTFSSSFDGLGGSGLGGSPNPFFSPFPTPLFSGSSSRERSRSRGSVDQDSPPTTPAVRHNIPEVQNDIDVLRSSNDSSWVNDEDEWFGGMEMSPLENRRPKKISISDDSLIDDPNFFTRNSRDNPENIQTTPRGRTPSKDQLLPKIRCDDSKEKLTPPAQKKSNRRSPAGRLSPSPRPVSQSPTRKLSSSPKPESRVLSPPKPFSAVVFPASSASTTNNTESGVSLSPDLRGRDKTLPRSSKSSPRSPARVSASPTGKPSSPQPGKYTHKKGGRRSSVSKETDVQVYDLEIAKVISGEDLRTALMIKNIPNKYSQEMLLEAVDEHHVGLYDFFYLPIDFKNKCNVGYAFINFIDPQTIPSFYLAFHQKKWLKFNSSKVCNITYARIQGKAAFIEHFRNSSLMHEDPKCRPLIFCSSGPSAGTPELFPTPHPRSPKNGFSSEDQYCPEAEYFDDENDRIEDEINPAQ